MSPLRWTVKSTRNLAATTTRTGLTVRARLDDGTYPTGVKVSNAQMAALPVSRHPFHGDWNYTLHPAAGPPAASGQEDRPAELAELTGLAPGDLDQLVAQLAALLDQHGYHIEPVTAPPDLPARIPAYIPQADGMPGNKIKSAC